MPSHRVTLLGREPLAEGTLGFRFEKPPGFAFKAGQAVVLELLEPPPGEGQKRRTFSLVSAPYESTLAIATRMRDSAFKRALKALPDGAAVKLLGPIGQFTLGDVARPAVFIAGGIGITPFMSMLRQSCHEGSGQRLLLAYSNRRREQAAFLAELEALERSYPSFRMLAVMSDVDGVIGEETLKRLAGDAVSPVYYLAGPPGMVASMSAILERSGVPDADVRSEEFYGY
jgi:ferredoxin-NADP reductase